MSLLTLVRRTTSKSWIVSLVVAAACSGAAAGCAPDDAMDPSQRNSPIIGGVATFDHPEVGVTSGYGCVTGSPSASPCVLTCTATLVSSHVAITAAHCVHYESRDTPGTSYGQLVLSDGTPTANLGIYRVVGYRSFGTSGNGSVNDLALLRLEGVQAPGFAVTPAGLASALPPNGEVINDFGYGCTNRSTNAGAGVKRVYTYRFDSNDEPDRSCPGDSGGPHIASAGQIVRINSGYVSSAFTEHDEYGDPVRHHAELVAQIAAWDPAPCAGATVACGAGCADLQTDSANCGGCGFACSAGRSCQAGQCAAAALFADVPASDPNVAYIELLYRRGITTGCASTPLQFCPADSLTRGQMAVFVMRAAFGEDFAASSTPYFTDVPPTHSFFRYVQGLRDRGITSGCTPDTFCVDSPVTRGEAAVFVVRAALGESFAAPTTPYFDDVPPEHPFFRYVQMARSLGIDAGCSGSSFCVDAPITRAQMAAMVARGLLGAS